MRIAHCYTLDLMDFNLLIAYQNGIVWLWKDLHTIYYNIDSATIYIYIHHSPLK